jgi:hypothetical protein
MGNVRERAEVNQFISELPQELQEITVALRKIILEASPELVEEFKWSMPNYSYHGLVCYLQTAKSHVNLGFHKGNELLDIKKLLQGTGKAMRHIRIKRIEEIQPEVFTSYIKEAIALNIEEKRQ